MKTITEEQFKKLFGENAYNNFGTTPKKEPGYFQRLGQSFQKTSLDIGEGIQKSAETISKGTEMAKEGDFLGGLAETSKGIVRAGLRGAGGFSEIVLSPLMEAPGVKQATEFVGEKLAETSPIQKYVEWSQKHPEAAKDIENVLDIASLIGAGKVAQTGLNVTKATIPEIQAGAKELTTKVATKAKTLTENTPQNIMNRVARLNPTDELKFTKVAGKSPGQYLVDTGNFGNPQDIITKESLKFIQSKNLVDDALSKLPGSYKLKPINTALEELIKKGNKVSSPGARAEYLQIAKGLLQKSKSQGLSMSDINGIKRLFEREVKLGYNKTLNPDLVDKFTRIDSAIRKWQFSKAIDLGFKNIAQMNKQTQISKFLVDKLGNKVVGQQALNNITLTDWIMLSGGNPTAVAGFLTKKFFSSKSVQARIAQILSGKKSTMKFPETSFTPEYLKRPTLPPGKSPGEYPIIPKAPTTYEPGVPIKKVQGEIPKTTLGNKVNSLAQEARKYKSAEEFVKTYESLNKNRAYPYELFDTAAQKSGEQNVIIKPHLEPFIYEAQKAESFAKFARGVYEIPVEDLAYGAPEYILSPGISKTPAEPIMVSPPMQGGGKFIVGDGNHRLRDAIKNGEKTIKVKFDPSSYTGKSFWGRLQDFYDEAIGKRVAFTKSQLTDIYNQVWKKPNKR